MAKHQGNRAVMLAMQKIQEKLMAAMGGMGGGHGGGHGREHAGGESHAHDGDRSSGKVPTGPAGTVS
eukprot:SAG11_NODE_37109_length_258_cov_0.968553_1_plen_66_part_10